MTIWWTGGQLGFVHVMSALHVPTPLTLVSTWDGDELSLVPDAPSAARRVDVAAGSEALDAALEGFSASGLGPYRVGRRRAAHERGGWRTVRRAWLERTAAAAGMRLDGAAGRRRLRRVENEAQASESGPDSSAERGRRQVVAVAVSVIGAVVLPAALGATPLVALMMQLVLFGLLFVQLFRGRAWARWILVALTAFIAAAHAAAAAGLAGPGGAQGISIAFAILFGWSALVLALSRHVAGFVRTQRGRHP